MVILLKNVLQEFGLLLPRKPVAQGVLAIPDNQAVYVEQLLPVFGLPTNEGKSYHMTQSCFSEAKFMHCY